MKAICSSLMLFLVFPNLTLFAGDGPSPNENSQIEIKISTTMDSPCDVPTCSAGHYIRQDLIKSVRKMCQSIPSSSTRSGGHTAKFTKDSVVDLGDEIESGGRSYPDSHKIEFVAKCVEEGPVVEGDLSEALESPYFDIKDQAFIY